MTALQYLLNSTPTLHNFKNFQWTPIPGSTAGPRIFKENLLTNFGLIDVFMHNLHLFRTQFTSFL